MKLLTVIGTRPQYMKLDKRLKQVIVDTGQHYDKNMKDIFFKELGLPKPDYDLSLTNVGEMIDKLTEIIKKENPDYVLVYGDTNSTLAGALAAKQCRKKLIHVEAGMRSDNMEMLEEQNRRVVDQLSDILLVPSQSSLERLEKEGALGRIGVCGNVMIDTIWEALPTKDLRKEYGKYYLLTLHRAETVDDELALKEVFEALGEVEHKIIFPLHPRTAKRIKEFDIMVPKNIEVIQPVGYKKMISMIGSAKKVITDSGGIQVEAHFLRTPCVTLRGETEWTETVDQGWNILVGTDKDSILKGIAVDVKKAKTRNLVYGDGHAKDKIKNFIESL